MSRAFVLLAASLVNSTGDAGTGDAGNLNTTTNTDLLRNLPFHLTSLLSRDTEHSAEASNDRFAEFSYEFLPEQPIVPLGNIHQPVLANGPLVFVDDFNDANLSSNVSMEERDHERYRRDDLWDDGRILALHDDILVVRYRQLLGRGGFGRVDLVDQLDLQTGEVLGQFALKRIIPRHGQVCTTFGREVRAVQWLCDNVPGAAQGTAGLVGAIKWGTRGTTGYLMYPFLKDGSLGDFLKANGFVSPIVSLRIVGQILEALKVFHAGEWLHRDIRPDNILISEISREGTTVTDIRVAIADFGLSERGQRNFVGHAGTDGCMAPEVASWKAGMPPYGANSDLWPVGGILLYCLTGRWPKYGFTEADFSGQVFQGPLGEPLEKLVRGLAKFHPRHRADIDDAIEYVQFLLGGDANIPAVPAPGAPAPLYHSGTPSFGSGDFVYSGAGQDDDFQFVLTGPPNDNDMNAPSSDGYHFVFAGVDNANDLHAAPVDEDQAFGDSGEISFNIDDFDFSDPIQLEGQAFEVEAVIVDDAADQVLEEIAEDAIEVEDNEDAVEDEDNEDAVEDEDPEDTADDMPEEFALPGNSHPSMDSDLTQPEINMGILPAPQPIQVIHHGAWIEEPTGADLQFGDIDEGVRRFLGISEPATVVEDDFEDDCASSTSTFGDSPNGFVKVDKDDIPLWATNSERWARFRAALRPIISRKGKDVVPGEEPGRGAKLFSRTRRFFARK